MAPQPAVIVAVAHTWDGAPVGPDERVSLGLRLDADALHLEVDAPWHGDPPPGSPPGATDRLWEHEVVELFLVGPPEDPRHYTEIELGPHGHHLILRLEGVRRPVAVGLPCAWRAWREGARWRGHAQVARDLLPASIVAFNAYAIHGLGEGRRYLAHQAVPGPAADFHRLEHFAAWPPRAAG